MDASYGPCPSPEELSAFTLGKATVASWETIARHVAACDACPRALRRLSDAGDPVLAGLRALAGARQVETPPAGGWPGDPGQTTDRRPTKAARAPLEGLSLSFEPRLPEELYELGEKIGEGGMGVVYRAWQKRLKRSVAVKVIAPHAHGGPEAVARFQREAEAVARLQHPNVVLVYELNVHEGQPYLAMELLEGGTLAQKLAAGPLPEQVAARVVQVLARAAQAAHEAGIVHRDLKPSNVLLAADGTPKLSDFGLAKWFEVEDGTQSQSDSPVGTACYMAPEQAGGRARDIGPRTDVYGLGAILYEALTGRPPHKAATRLETLEEVRTREAVPPSRHRPGLSADLEAVCGKCLETDPARRYGSAGELADDLGRWLAGQPTQARPQRWPERCWRAARRHPVWSAAAALCLLAALAAPAVVFHLQPARRAEALQRRLARGEAVTLIGPTGGPAWSRWLTGGHQAALETDPGQPLQVHTSGLSLLALLPGPGRDRYRLRAQVRHEKGDLYSKVGLFVAQREHASARGPVHLYVELCYDDLNFPVHRLAPPLRDQYKEKVGDRNPVYLHPRIWSDPDPRFGAHWDLPCAGQDPTLFRPAGIPQVRWRSLVAEVTPEGVRGFFDGRPLGERLSAFDLVTSLTQTINGMPSIRPGDPTARAVPPGFHPGGSLGLFVENGVASFKDVVIEACD
jgi:serine/threonine-protein kinase